MKFVKGQRVAVEPQPAADNIIVFKRYYISLKRDSSFRKRISTVIQCPDSMTRLKTVSVVEYVGIYHDLIEAKKTPREI